MRPCKSTWATSSRSVDEWQDADRRVGRAHCKATEGDVNKSAVEKKISDARGKLR